MAIAVIASGTQTASVSAEITLTTDTTGKTSVLAVDTGSLALGDSVTLRLKTIILSGGTEREAYVAYYSQPQAQPQKYSVPVPADQSVKATLQQTDGTARQFPWSLLSLD